VFPLRIWDEELQWKISLDYDVQRNAFALSINDEPLLDMPYQAEVAPDGAQNIEKGMIVLNQVDLLEGFAQYTADTIDEWREDHNLQPTTDVLIGYLTCTSSEVLNSVFDDIGRTIDKEKGLKSFTIWKFKD